jgi:HK97 family phage major capsid protein
MEAQEKETIINDLAAKVKEKNDAELKEIKDFMGGLDAEKLNALMQKDLVENSSFETLKNLVTEVKEEIKELNDRSETPKTAKAKLVAEVKSKKEDLRKLVKGHKNVVEIKALSDRASITDNTEAVRLSGFGQLAYTAPRLYDVIQKIPVGDGNHNGTIRYIDWDEATSVKAAAMVAEGAVFPESTAKFIEYNVPLRKVGDTLPVTEEFGEDEVAAAGELGMFLQNNVMAKIGEQVAVGDGTGQNLTGLYNLAPTFTAVASGIADANIKDLVRKMRTSIVKGRGSKYQPNIVVANSDVIDQYILKKDGDNNYMFDMNTNTIAGLTIVEDNNMADNTIVVGDSRYATIYERPGIELSEGLVNAQFTEDIKTIKARARLLFLIRNANLTGFTKSVDIAADLVTLAT